jgi:phosphoserine phosphatase
MNPVLLSKAEKIFKTGKTIQKALSDHQRGNPHVYQPKLIFFDMDGVLTVKPHTTQLAEMIGKQGELLRISEKMLSKPDRGFEWLINEMITLFAGVPESLLTDAGKRLPLMKGAPETIKTLKKGGITLF